MALDPFKFPLSSLLRAFKRSSEGHATWENVQKGVRFGKDYRLINPIARGAEQVEPLAS